MTLEATNLKELCLFFKTIGVNKIYLIHEPYREREVRRFASKLEREGFIPLVAQDYRVRGKKAVDEAIGLSDFSLVVAFDDETVRTCHKNSIAVFDMHAEVDQNEA